MPSFYNPYYQQQYYPTQYPNQQNMAPTQQTQSSFVTVSSETEARNYPIAPGNCVTFKIEGQPIVMEKSMGFSQFESPKIDRYRLVKEDVPQEVKEEEVKKENEELKKLRESLKITDEDVEDIRRELETLWGEINVLKQPKRPTKREKDGDD